MLPRYIYRSPGNLSSSRVFLLLVRADGVIFTPILYAGKMERILTFANLKVGSGTVSAGHLAGYEKLWQLAESRQTGLLQLNCFAKAHTVRE